MSDNASRRTDRRSVALDDYLERRQADGYEVETRSTSQAVIIRRQRLSFLLRLTRSSIGQRRLVVSVDDEGEITTIAAEPARW